MTMKKNFPISVSRRDFVKLTGLAAVGLVMDNGNLPKAEAKTSDMAYGEKKLPVLYDVDVCVVGGGPSGTAAAVNAAKKGAKTVLVERLIRKMVFLWRKPKHRYRHPLS